MPNTPNSIGRKSHIAAYGFAIASVLEEYGIDPAVVFEACDVRLPNTTDPMLRMSSDEINRLFKESVRVTGSLLFGLQAGRSVRPGNLHALGYALMASTSLRDFCQRVSAFSKIASQSADIHIEETSREVRLISSLVESGLCWEIHDAFAALVVSFIRFIGIPTFRPLRLELMRPEPEGDIGEYEAFFNCPIYYNCPDDVVAFSQEQAGMRLQGGNAELANMHDKKMMQYLSEIEENDVVNRVRAVIVSGLSVRIITREHVARKLCMSSRNLQLKLANEGTSFNKILDSTRQSLGMGYLGESTITVTEASYLTGFSDACNFTRAFRRWTGQSPSEFRVSQGIKK